MRIILKIYKGRLRFSKKIIIPTNVKRIEKGAFSEGTFEKVIFPEELKYIGDFAF